MLAGCEATTEPSASIQPPPSAASSDESAQAVAGYPDEPPGASEPISADLPNTGRIAFEVEWGPNGDENKNIYSIKPDGTNLLMLTHRQSGQSGQPTWSPDGTLIVFSAADETGGTAHIFSMVPDGGSVTQLTFGAGWAGAPVFSPDGRRIAYDWHLAEDTEAIYVMDAEGGHLTQITYPPVGSADLRPSFSPDGTTLAFDRNGAVYLIGLDGRGLRRLTPEGAQIDPPVWSPDGTRILFSNEDGMQVMNADGTGLVSLGNGGNPSWSPDGAMIVFQRYTQGTAYFALVVANADGSNPIEIWHSTPSTNTFVNDPSWGISP
jgi:TolB protein